MTLAELAALDCAVAKACRYKPEIVSGTCYCTRPSFHTGAPDTWDRFSPTRDYELTFRLMAERGVDLEWRFSHSAVTALSPRTRKTEYFKDHNNESVLAAAVAVCRAIVGENDGSQ